MREGLVQQVEYSHVDLPCVASFHSYFCRMSINNMRAHEYNKVFAPLPCKLAKRVMQILHKKFRGGDCTVGMRSCKKNNRSIARSKGALSAYDESIIRHDLPF